MTDAAVRDDVTAETLAVSFQTEGDGAYDSSEIQTFDGAKVTVSLEKA